MGLEILFNEHSHVLRLPSPASFLVDKFRAHAALERELLLARQARRPPVSLFVMD
jgi:hypothetical protein